jgi:hypothetical protein
MNVAHLVNMIVSYLVAKEKSPVDQNGSSPSPKRRVLQKFMIFLANYLKNINPVGNMATRLFIKEKLISAGGMIGLVLRS